MDWVEPRSTSSHCGSEKALDQRVPRLPSTAFEAGEPAFSREDAVAGLFSAASVVPQVPPPDAGPENPEPYQAEADWGARGGAVLAVVGAGAGYGEGLGAAGAGGGGVDRGPGGAVGGGLDLEGLAVGGFPVQRDLADGLGGAEVDFEPLRVGEGAGPAGAQVAVHRVRGRGAGVLQGGRGGGLVQRGVGGAAGSAA